MTHRLFGIETEYGLAATADDGDAVDNAAVASEVMSAARRRLSCVRGVNQSGVFLGNGSRFYIDCGAHPEFCTPEVTTPEEAVAYVAAGERILFGLADDVARIHGWRVMLLRGNVDYQAGVTYGRHESYLHVAASEALEQQLTPHIVSRVLFGAGGFNAESQGIEFSLSPRSAFFSRARSEGSTVNRGIIHTKQEPLAGSGYRRLHVICPGDTLLSQTGIYLNIATTALLVALVEAGEQPGEAVHLANPVAALQAFAKDPTCRTEVGLTQGGTASALAIQRHYLERTEHALKEGRLPEWAPEVCVRWRAILDRLERGPEAVAGTLDWATKLSVYGDHARERGFGWNAIAFWTGVTNALHSAIQRADAAASSCEEVLGPSSPIRDEVEALTPSVMQRGEDWSRLRRFIDLRQEFYALDTRWGELETTGIWAGLDAAGSLSHRIVKAEAVETAVATPPPRGRAKLRGQLIQEAHANGLELRADWDRIVDELGSRVADLADPFSEQIVWRPMKRDPEPERPSWPEVLRRELRSAPQDSEPLQELFALARVLDVPAFEGPAGQLMRRVLEIVEESFRPDHPIVAACLRDLARHLPGRDRAVEARSMLVRAELIEGLNACRRSEGPEHPAVALGCNELAVCLRGLGLASQAEQLLRQAVAIEDRVLAPNHPKRPHRLNNLASVLLMQDKLEEACRFLDRAWQLQNDRHDLTSARILCLRLALEWVEGRDGTPFLGQLKTLSAEPHLGTEANISTTWEISAVWESLRPRLPEGRVILLQQVSTLLNDRSMQRQLGELPEWRDALAVPLEAPWPERVAGVEA